MKVKFNLPSKRYTNNFSFDNNTTLGIGNVQPLFCKSLVAGSKVSIGFSQLTRLSPLVVPTLKRWKIPRIWGFPKVNNGQRDT